MSLSQNRARAKTPRRRKKMTNSQGNAATNPKDAVAPDTQGNKPSDAGLLDDAGKDDSNAQGLLDQAGDEAKQEQLAEEKRLREADDATLTAEERTKKDAILKADKEAAEKAKAEAVPEKYEFKVPEGMTLDQSLVDKVSPIFKDMKLSQANAQKLVDFYAEDQKAKVEAGQAELEKFRSEALKETEEAIKSDRKGNMAYLTKARNTLFSKDSIELIKAAGLDNCKSIIMDLIAFGKTISEDKLVDGKTQVANEDKPPAQRIYPGLK
jgi:hypothetical protein